MVFLNGCSTLGQVDHLLRSGIPAVIATERPVDDVRAKEFAFYFYQSLVGGASLEKAFQQAAAVLQTKTGKLIQIYRGQGLETGKHSHLEWGLYIADQAVLEWCLPKAPPVVDLFKGVKHYQKKHLRIVDQQLIQDLFETLKSFKPELARYGHFDQIGKRSLRLLRRDIIDSLPAPLGEQIRKLFSADSGPDAQIMRTISIERLRQLVYTYEILMDMVLAIMLTQLWECMVKKETCIISEELQHEFAHFFSLDKDESLLYDQSDLIKNLYFFFHENQVDPLVSELKQIDRTLFEDEGYLEALQFMEELKRKLFSSEIKIAADELTSLCLQAEDYLGAMFRKWGFCAKYHFVSIKDIKVNKSRHRSPSFIHNTVFLDMVTVGYEDEESVYTSYVDNSSIILLRSPDDMSEYLSLSPFIIDENALKDLPHTKIYIYSHYDRAHETIYYHSIFDFEQYLAVNKLNFPNVFEQFDEYLKLVLRRRK